MNPSPLVRQLFVTWIAVLIFWFHIAIGVAFAQDVPTTIVTKAVDRQPVRPPALALPSAPGDPIATNSPSDPPRRHVRTATGLAVCEHHVTSSRTITDRLPASSAASTVCG